MVKTIFWNVDTQYDFMRSDESYQGKLAIPKAREIEEKLEKLTHLAASSGITVINTADWHTPRSEEFSDAPDFVQTFHPHCLMNSRGAEFVPATNPHNPYIIDWQQNYFDPEEALRRRNLILYKDKFDVFTGTPHAHPLVRLLQPDSAIVYGVATNVCVDYAVRGLLDQNVQVFVPTDAIKELPNLPLQSILDSWVQRNVVLTTTENIARLLK